MDDAYLGRCRTGHIIAGKTVLITVVFPELLESNDFSLTHLNLTVVYLEI